MAYSTIRQKTGECSICGNRGPLIKGLCHNHYWLGVRMKSVEKQLAKEEDVLEDDTLASLIQDADIVFSRYLRMKAANENGFCYCFICDGESRWQDAQVMHFVKRGNLFLRWDERNCKVGDNQCNVIKGGNYSAYIKRLEEEHPGITEILVEESRLVYKPTRDELHQIIADYSTRIKQLK